MTTPKKYILTRKWNKFSKPGTIEMWHCDGTEWLVLPKGKGYGTDYWTLYSIWEGKTVDGVQFKWLDEIFEYVENLVEKEEQDG